ncbi:hypothetical protein E9536_08490 [Burkholderia sp. LS-044]|uniref:hypothetical protein n=1 Tax=Burkholderia sp. LS-044 TaxID=1459967 RepID=UPI0010A5BC54|nr:hypothetical protein [Burkholderia sp. LS-044]THJ54915.1 hypothetical protein E9536_08490 [Burkholderia sp. LS-044]
MAKYCITGANHNGAEDHRASEFNVWERKLNNDKTKWVWGHVGKKSLDYVASLLAKGHEVVSGEEGKDTITPGAPIEIVLRIAKNDENFKITDLPEF